ncbi:hypothetical protein [Sphingomonas sp.]|uniref:hypothetical protein n=1 Tax=Sphingomonas sp. TaxID=28214 RepID=UPI002D19D156|nr:hypothetical protein [Sphingomonas sp.]HTG37188.1 hypothetical protein [Sphingomonas sp.]
MRIIMAVAVCTIPLLSGGCIAKTAWDVATLPVKAGGQAIDWTTTSQEEADRNYGRKMRKREAEEGRRLREEQRRREREERQWRDDDD